MKIKTLKIENFRNLENFDISFDERLTVLVANNSSGKTSILDAISIIFGSYIGAFPTESNNGFKFRDASIITRGDEPKYPIKVSSDIILDNQQVHIFRELLGKKSRTTTVNTKPLQEYAKNKYTDLLKKRKTKLPILAYYGTGRLYKETKHSKEKYDKEKSSRSYAYHNCLNPNSSYKEFREWFIEQSQIQINNLIKNIQKEQNINISQLPESKLLNNIQKSIDITLESLKWNNLHFNGEDLVIENADNVSISIDNLSDGVKNILTLVADIAYRCSKLNPHLINPVQETKGIILIDEIEMHLHPSWQQRIIKDLLDTFSNIQFIITTHSPQVISSIKNTNIRIIEPKNEEALIPNINPYGKESVVALEDIMNVSSTPPKSVIKEGELLEEYLNLIYKGDINNQKLSSMRKELEKTYGSDYSKLLIADMIINKFKAQEK